MSDIPKDWVDKEDWEIFRDELQKEINREVVRAVIKWKKIDDEFPEFVLPIGYRREGR